MKTKMAVLSTLIIFLLLSIFTSIVPASSVANIEKAGKRSDGRIKFKVTCSF
ncbi:secreted protein, partial [Candidatus Magnetomorum sp. HK-1]